MDSIKHGDSECRITFLSPRDPLVLPRDLSKHTCTLLDTILLGTEHVLFSPSLSSIQNQFFSDFIRHHIYNSTKRKNRDKPF